MIMFFIIFVAEIGEAFFSGAETAFISVNFLKLMHLIEKKNKAAMLVHDILKKPDRFLATTLIGENLCVVVASACAAALFAKLSLAYGALLTTMVMTPLTFIFCQLLPKTVFRYRANRAALFIAPAVSLSEKVFMPLVNFFTFFANSVARVVNPKGLRRNPFLTKDEIKSLIKDISREGILEPHEKEAIDKIFDMTLTKAADLMVPAKNVVSLDVSMSLAEVREKARATSVTRFPVFEGKALKGMLNIYDMLYSGAPDWKSSLRPVLKVDSNESLDKVFSLMQPSQEVLAAVVKGNDTVGILTMEDLMEHIVSRLSVAGP
jgi:putative hemolysin